MERLIRFLKAFFKYLLIGDEVTEDVYTNRISTCNSCKFLDNGICSVCTCNVKRKAKWTTEKCPKNKW